MSLCRPPLRRDVAVADDVEVRPTLGDLRFRALLSGEDWESLPPPIRRRFSKRLDGGRTSVYVGKVVETRMNPWGLVLARLACLIGGPLPTARDAGLESVVAVTEDLATGGQIWTRLYARRKGFPQIIHSSKRFAGPTGLEEYLGRGVGMALTIHAERGALIFRSAFYYLRLGKRRFALPRFLSPGALTVGHAETGDGHFMFTLDLVHPLLGELVHQRALFEETAP